jgi:hypothetical protein
MFWPRFVTVRDRNVLRKRKLQVGATKECRQ